MLDTLTETTENTLLFIYLHNQLLFLNESNSLELPSIATLNRCIEFQIVSDWYYETEYDYVCALLEADSPIPSGHKLVSLRDLFALGFYENLDKNFIGKASRGLALLNWRKDTRFCNFCGGPLYSSKIQTAKKCILCNKTVFPSISPAIIVEIYKDGKILLAKHKNRNQDVYTCVAGFVEPGETLEECVKREVYEETGLIVNNVTYKASQSWPFPDQLMIAFRADWVSGDIQVQEEELVEALWFAPDNLPSFPGKGSLAYKLITGEL